MAALHPEADPAARDHQLAAPGDLPARAADEPGAAGRERYMNFLCRPDAEALLAENDFARLWPFFTTWGGDRAASAAAGSPRTCAIVPGGLARRPHRRLQLLPRLAAAPAVVADDALMKVRSRPAMVTSRVPTLVIWAEDDIALPIGAARRPGGLRSRPARRARAGRVALDHPRAAGADQRRDRALPRAMRCRGSAEIRRRWRREARASSGRRRAAPAAWLRSAARGRPSRDARARAA